MNEIRQALSLATDDVRVSVIILTSDLLPENIRTPAFCAGGDQSTRRSDVDDDGMGGGGYDDGKIFYNKSEKVRNIYLIFVENRHISF